MSAQASGLATVSGTIRNKTWTALSVGDMISGYTYGGHLVTGTVVDTGDDRVEIEGITVRDTRRGRWTVYIRDVLTSVSGQARTA